MYKNLMLSAIVCMSSLVGDVPYVSSGSDIEKFLALQEKDIGLKKIKEQKEFEDRVALILNEKKRTFENTVRALDIAIGELEMAAGLYGAMGLVHPSAEMRATCDDAQNDLQKTLVGTLYSHPELYEAFAAVQSSQEDLSSAEKYYLQKGMDELKEMGCHLSLEKRELVSALRTEINELSLIFEKNIREDNSELFVTRQELAGLENDFIESLTQNEKGEYRLTCDYPIYFPVAQHCSIASTRKQMYNLFNNRAYPANEEVLHKIIAKRDQLAKALGFNSYADYDLNSEMVGKVEKATTFLNNLQQGVSSKLIKEVEALKASLPASVELTPDGKIHAYDASFLATQYKKENLSLDDRKISEYFPLENTLKGLISVYESFFSLEIKEMKGNFWDEKVKLLCLKKAGEDTVLGYLLLDLFPRKNKYGHACETTLIPSYKNYPALSLVVANFPQETKTKPALLTHNQVTTLFHEFGHAIHDILGRNEFMLLCGTQVKRDFVELPSQLLEEWLWDPAILKKISSHYETKEPLSDEYIQQMLTARNCHTALWVERQCSLSQIALSYFKEGEIKDCAQIAKQERANTAPFFEPEENDHFYLSFGHLTGYGAKYYGYIWSRVFALDVFSQISEEGLLNPKAGAKYVDMILGKGGSEDPNEMLRNFLKREPSEKPFIKSYGI
jgi:thimet oligopeptidase